MTSSHILVNAPSNFGHGFVMFINVGYHLFFATAALWLGHSELD